MTKKISTTQKIELILSEISNSKKYPSNVIIRAKILLLSREFNNCEIAEKLNISRKAVGKWKNKYYDKEKIILKKSEELSLYSLKKFLIQFLSDSPRTGKPNKVNDEQAKFLLELARSDPKELSVSNCYWNLDSLTSYFNNTISDIQISKTTSWRILKRNRFNIQNHKYWKKKNEKPNL